MLPTYQQYNKIFNTYILNCNKIYKQILYFIYYNGNQPNPQGHKGGRLTDPAGPFAVKGVDIEAGPTS